MHERKANVCLIHPQRNKPGEETLVLSPLSNKKGGGEGEGGGLLPVRVFFFFPFNLNNL